MADGAQLADLVRDAAELLRRPLSLVRRLTGGEHAETVLVSDGVTALVARRFPAGDAAVSREVDVLGRVMPLGDLVPSLVAARTGQDGGAPLVVTTQVPGAPGC